jgi:cell division protease FtsH
MLEKIKEFYSKKPFGVFLLIVGFFSVLLFLSYLIDTDDAPKKISHSSFVSHLKQNNIKEIRCDDGKVYGSLKDNTKFETNVHLTDELWNKIHQNDVIVNINDKDSSTDSFYMIIFGLFFLFVMLIFYYNRKNKDSNSRGVSSIFSLGKSRFKKNNPGEVKTRFSDVAGAKKAKDALSDIVEFLKNPEKFKSMGAHSPKGILLAGEPGNGKTLLARAVAGEANCTFISISGADFIEVFVGVGAARIRDLFHQARKSAPCILFIDEIDAIGRSRGSGFGGGHDEREQTLNQLLTEMDGFDQFDKTIVVLAATNMPEVLDKALLRPGRFDRVIYVPYPDFNARLELLQIYLKGIQLEPNFKINRVAEITQGLSGADLENLVNIALLKASKSERQYIIEDDFKSAYKDILNSKKDIQASSNDKAKEFLPQQVNTKFIDIAGLEDAKDDLVEVVDFLKDPTKYQEMGARIPKGILLTGDPGNGKTLLARGLAGEAGVPFFYASGSQFVQKYVGEGAARIRELFTQARRHGPAIIFIDELDSIGKRQEECSGGNSEYNQTINQLLTEMDGFVQGEEPIIVIGATNLVDNIDKALKRPGRFDRIVNVPYPSLEARKKILNIHARGKKFNETVDLDTVARGTSGFSGAQLEALLNESAILAVTRRKQAIDSDDIEEAKDRVLVGKKNHGLVRTHHDIKRTAYHEAGHSILKILLEDYPYDFYKVTILPRGGTLGVSWGLPKDDHVSYTKEQLYALIVVCMGGRVAEKIIFNKVCTGASGDFKQATDTAFNMVRYYGMGSVETGMVSYKDYRDFSEEAKKLVDNEVKKILDDAYAAAIALLEENIQFLHAVADALLVHETLDAEQVHKILGRPYHGKEKVTVPEKESADNSEGSEGSTENNAI